MKKSTMKNGRPWTTEDEKLLDELPMEEQSTVLAWIRNNLVPGNDTDANSSYGLKHLMTHDTGIYVTNNQFKDAMHMCGFKPTRTSDLNWEYKLHRRSPAFIPRNKRITDIPAMRPEDEDRQDTFYGWMQRRYGKSNSPKGDLASDMFYDLTWPRENSYSVICRYLEHVGACDLAWDAFYECWKEYTAQAHAHHLTVTDSKKR